MKTEKLIEIVSSALADMLCDGCDGSDIPCWKCRDEASKIVTHRLREYEALTAEPKRGEWILSKSLDDGYWVCSCCGFVSEASGANILYRYCPNCGCRMRGEKE